MRLLFLLLAFPLFSMAQTEEFENFSIGISKYSKADSVKLRFSAREESFVSFYKGNEFMRRVKLSGQPRVFIFEKKENLKFQICEDGLELFVYVLSHGESYLCQGRLIEL